MRQPVCSERPSCTLLALTSVAVGLAVSSPAAADINLELRPSTSKVFVGDEFTVSVYAVSDTPASQFLGAIEAVLQWPTGSVQLIANDGGGTPLSFQGFPVAGSAGLNESSLPQDGDALYIALGPLGVPVPATAGGTLITNLRFVALAPDANAVVAIATSGGSPPRQTTVFSGIVPNLDVTGTLENAMVIIHPPPCSPADLAEPFGVLNFFDVSAYLTAYVLANPAADFAPPFGTLNFFDVSEFLTVYNQGCP
jgi:hypothetical protein